jgi:hypothetical protein
MPVPGNFAGRGISVGSFERYDPYPKELIHTCTPGQVTDHGVNLET